MHQRQLSCGASDYVHDLQELETAFKTAISRPWGSTADPVITVSQNEKFGDYQAKCRNESGQTRGGKHRTENNPRTIAEQIRANCSWATWPARSALRGRGFINVRLSPDALAKRVEQAAGDPRLESRRLRNPKRWWWITPPPTLPSRCTSVISAARSSAMPSAGFLEFQGHRVHPTKTTSAIGAPNSVC